MIRETTGDILTADDDEEALVNPVNTVGVMGAGLAAQVKHTFPAVFYRYVVACRSGELRPGIVIPHPTGTNPPEPIPATLSASRLSGTGMILRSWSGSIRG
jgi:O-acetyl-ADP-ribose deacetylase (regulator of RNase III)